MWSHHLDILFMENNRYTVRSICKELNGLIIFYMQCVLYHDKPSLFFDNQQHLITTIHSLLTVVKRIFLSKNRLFWSNLQNIGKYFLSIVVPCDGQYRFYFQVRKTPLRQKITKLLWWSGYNLYTATFWWQKSSSWTFSLYIMMLFQFNYWEEIQNQFHEFTITMNR